MHAVLSASFPNYHGWNAAGRLFMKGERKMINILKEIFHTHADFLQVYHDYTIITS
jgi:hypothetical protein